MKKKSTSLILALVMCIILAIPAMAIEPERVKITVEREDEITEFLNSPQYDQNKFYTFTCTSLILMRILCPNCGSNSYRGVTKHKEMDIHQRMCPSSSDTSDDFCTEFDVCTYSKCNQCGYKTSRVFLNKYWKVACHVETPDGHGSYIARSGQS